MDFATFVFIGSGLGLLFGISLLFNRRVRSVDLTLIAGLLVALSVAMAVIMAEHERVLPVAGWFLETIEFAISLSSGPILYLYIRSKRQAGYQFIWRDPLHFIPMIAVMTITLARQDSPIPFRAVMVHQMSYTAVCVAITASARNRRPAEVARLFWPRRFVFVAIVIHAAQIIRTVFFEVELIRNIVPITGVTSLFIMSIIAFRRAILESIGKSGLPEEKYSRSALDRVSAEELGSRLEEAMIQDRAFADPDLTLDRLARKLDVSPHVLSQVLNENLEKGFFQYVTEYRLEDARQRLADPENDRFTIDAIAEAAGFSSRSTFYAAFRRQHEMTPTAYRRIVRSQNLPKSMA